MKIDGISAIAVIFIASFAIDRIVTGLLFLMSFVQPWRRAFPDPGTISEVTQRIQAERRQKLSYFVLAGILGILVLGWFGKIRIFSVSGFPNIDPVLDTIVTGLILVGGSDRIAAILKMSDLKGQSKSSPQPIEITGRLTLEEPRSGRIVG